MTSDTVTPSAAGITTADQRESGFRLKAAGLVFLGALGFFLAFVWDIQWHADVGPETFFTGPHALLYGTTALTGLTALTMVIVTTLKYRRGAPAVTDATTTPWLGRLHAPVEFVVAGLGAAAFILSGLYDLYWHTLYGFDVTLISPPHFGLLHPAALGASAAMAVLLAQFSIFLIIALSDIRVVGPFNLYALVAAMVFPAGLVAAASLVRLPGAATLAALFFSLLKLFTMWFGPWSVRTQAEIMGYSYREGAEIFPLINLPMPAYLLAMGALIDLVLWAGRRAKVWPRLVVWIAGAAGALVNHLIDPRWLKLADEVISNNANVRATLEHVYAPTALPTLIAVPLTGALLGWLGWNLGVLLRYTNR